MATYTYQYDTIYQPAMPTVQLFVRRATDTQQDEDEVERTITAIVDSGSDVTMLPLEVIQAIDARFAFEGYMRGVTGVRQAVRTYGVVVRLGLYNIFTEAVGDQRNGEAILGRDVLNQFIVTLNGLASAVEIAD